MLGDLRVKDLYQSYYNVLNESFCKPVESRYFQGGFALLGFYKGLELLLYYDLRCASFDCSIFSTSSDDDFRVDINITYAQKHFTEEKFKKIIVTLKALQDL